MSYQNTTSKNNRIFDQFRARLYQQARSKNRSYETKLAELRTLWEKYVADQIPTSEFVLAAFADQSTIYLRAPLIIINHQDNMKVSAKLDSNSKRLSQWGGLQRSNALQLARNWSRLLAYCVRSGIIGLGIFTFCIDAMMGRLEQWAANDYPPCSKADRIFIEEVCASAEAEVDELLSVGRVTPYQRELWRKLMELFKQEASNGIISLTELMELIAPELWFARRSRE